MANTPANRDSAGSSGVEPDLDSPPSTPRWVKVFGSGDTREMLSFVVGGGRASSAGHG